MDNELTLSTSQVTGKQYEIPSHLDDKENINNFISSDTQRSVIAVQGLGFVGSVMSLVCANALTRDYSVLGVDLPEPESYWRIRSLNEGVFPLTAEDPKIQEFYDKARDQGNFYATYDPYAYAVADVIIVDINLDVEKDTHNLGELVDYEVNLTGFKEAVRAIGKQCKEDVLVLVETTVPPGTSQNLIRPILEDELSRRGMRTDCFKLGHSYERVMPGPNYVDSIRTFPRVYSGIDERSAEATEEFLKTIIDTDQCPLTRLGSTNATEMAKVLENTYRAMNIAFVAEWSRYAEEAGVDLYSVVNAVRQRPTHANLMYPGIGVGGYCLTKDPLLASWSRRNFFGSQEGLEQSESAVKINDRMPVFAYDFLKEKFGSLCDVSVLLLGVSYRGEVGDTRFSPVELFYDSLQSDGADITLHDPYVAYWADKSLQVHDDLETALENAPQVVALTTGHELYKQASTVDMLMNLDGLFIYDTIGLLSEEQIMKLSEHHRVTVLGRGDL